MSVTSESLIAPAATVAPLFTPFSVKDLNLANRIVMAPMTRYYSPNGIPGADVAEYYKRRAEHGVGLIITEGTYIPHPAAGDSESIPRIYGDASLAGWKVVVDAVHSVGGKIFPQLWHIGMVRKRGDSPNPGVPPIGPSGYVNATTQTEEPATLEEIEQLITAFGEAALNAKNVGFDGIELHGAHGYLIDQFFWEGTNRRTDKYGGSIEARAQFAVDVVREVRRQVGPDFTIDLRFSQWKQQDYNARLAQNPQELERLLAPLVEAGVDVFHASSRRFWEPEFEGSPLNLAGWTKKITGKPTITVGSITLSQDFIASFQSNDIVKPNGLNELALRLEQGEFDLVAVGRSLIANPDWADIVRSGDLTALKPYSRDLAQTLL